MTYSSVSSNIEFQRSHIPVEQGMNPLFIPSINFAFLSILLSNNVQYSLFAIIFQYLCTRFIIPPATLRL